MNDLHSGATHVNIEHSRFSSRLVVRAVVVHAPAPPRGADAWPVRRREAPELVIGVKFVNRYRCRVRRRLRAVRHEWHHLAGFRLDERGLASGSACAPRWGGLSPARRPGEKRAAVCAVVQSGDVTRPGERGRSAPIATRHDWPRLPNFRIFPSNCANALQSLSRDANRVAVLDRNTAVPACSC